MPLSLSAMNEAYPKNRGFFMHQEDKVGTIEDGKWTDPAVLEEDLFEIPAAHSGDAKVHMTLLQGEVVYRR
ncbi:MAG TPA: hypothetical protein EYQ22_10730 [Gammaproteobacteria bacterium]|nr:hypothetical protein [Gammaproteobacteria bacterium]HIK69483.1 hypothetical protein [Pseudomonadales bacterium]